MSQPAQRTDALAHIRPAGAQEVAHRVVQAKHGRLGDFGSTTPGAASLIRSRSGHGVRWETTRSRPEAPGLLRSIPRPAV